MNVFFLPTPFELIASAPLPEVIARLAGACAAAEHTSQKFAYCAPAADVRRLLQELALHNTPSDLVARLVGACDAAEHTSQKFAYCAPTADVRRLLEELNHTIPPSPK